MPRKIKNGLPKEELKFLESPKFIYHRSNVPVVHLSIKPVTLAVVPAEAVSKKWVTPCFTDKQTTPLKTRGRKPRQGRGGLLRSKLYSDISTAHIDTTSVIKHADADSRKVLPNFKPIAFRRLKDILSEVEDVKADDDDDDDDDCLVEDSNSEMAIAAVKKCVEKITGRYEEHKDESRPTKIAQKIDHVKTVNTLDQNAAINFKDLDSDDDEAQEVLTFNISLIKTPQTSFNDDDDDNIGNDNVDYEPSSAEVSIINHAEKKLSLRDADTTLHSSDQSHASPFQNTTDKSSRTFANRRRSHEAPGTPRQSRLPRRSSYTTSQTSPKPTGDRMLPSITRDLLPVFISASSNADYSAGSEKWFRSQFFDRVNIARETANKSALKSCTDRITTIPDSLWTSDADNNILKSHNTSRSKKLKPSPDPSILTTPDAKDKSLAVILAEDTPESDYGLTYRMKQVKNRPKIFPLVVKAAAKTAVT